MFCPKCGSNQGDSKKFCTVCGTNLLIVSQALTGQLAPPQPAFHHLPPAAIFDREMERQKEMRSGITMAVLGGSYLVYQLINFTFSVPFTNSRSPFGFGSFIAFIVCAVGISKIISSRVIANTAQPTTSGLTGPTFSTETGQSFIQPTGMPAQTALPKPVFSAAAPVHQPAPHTNELDPVQTTISVTEEDTKHLGR